MKRRWIWRIGRVILTIAVAVLALGFVTMGLWNALIPALFNGPVLTFWQAVGLLLLSHLLLRGGPGRFGGGWRRNRWRGRFEERRAAMTPEEREKFREEWGHRCGRRFDGGKTEAAEAAL